MFEVYAEMRRQIDQDSLIISRGITERLFGYTNWSSLKQYFQKRHL